MSRPRKVTDVSVPRGPGTEAAQKTHDAADSKSDICLSREVKNQARHRIKQEPLSLKPLEVVFILFDFLFSLNNNGTIFKNQELQKRDLVFESMFTLSHLGTGTGHTPFWLDSPS